MKLSGIKLRGFRGVRDTVDLSFTRGFTVISGRNGAGKTTICDGIEYVLCGEIRRGKDVSEAGEDYGDYIGWQGEGGGRIETLARLTFEGEDAKVVAERSPSGTLRVRVTGEDEVLEGREAESALARVLVEAGEEPESALERIIDTSLLRDERITQLSVDAGERERYEFVRRGLGTDVFSETSKRAVKICDELESRSGDLSARLSEAQDEVESLESEIEEVRGKAEDIGELDRAVEMVEGVLVEYGETDKDSVSELSKAQLVNRGRQIAIEIREKADELARYLSEYGEIREGVATYAGNGGAREREEALQSKKNDLELELEKVRSAKSEAERKLESFRESHPDAASLAELHRLGVEVGLIDEACPLCASPYETEEWSERLRSLRGDVEGIVEELNGLTRRIERHGERADELMSKQEEVTSQLQEIENARSEKVRRVRSVYDGIDNVVGSGGFVREIAEEWVMVGDEEVPILNEDRIGEEIEDRRRLQDDLSESTKEIEASVAYEKIDSLEKELDLAKEEASVLASKLERAESAVEEADEVRKEVEAERGEVHSDRIKRLAPLLLEIYRRLRPHVDWTNIAPKVRGKVRRFLRFDVGEGDMNPSLFFSSGERRAVGLAFLLSIHLGCSWNQFNTLVLDDPVQHIDDFRALQLTEVLSAIRRTGRQVVVTVEDESLARLLSRRLRSKEGEVGQHVGLEYNANVGVEVEFLERIEPLPSRVLEIA